VAWLCNERGAETVGKLLPFSVLPASVMAESLYRAKEKGHKLELFALHEAIKSMGVAVEPITDLDTVRAAELIGASRHGRADPGDPSLSLGDGLCLAVAERLGLPVAASDNHWKSLALRVEYLPFR
jgi:PIN domain nuclease of toxin-antitoxin system